MTAASETSLLRKSLLSIGIAVGGSALFTGACLVFTSLALDRAVPSTQADSDHVDHTEVAEPPIPRA